MLGSDEEPSTQRSRRLPLCSRVGRGDAASRKSAGFARRGENGAGAAGRRRQLASSGRCGGAGARIGTTRRVGQMKGRAGGGIAAGTAGSWTPIRARIHANVGARGTARTTRGLRDAAPRRVPSIAAFAFELRSSVRAAPNA